MKSYDPLVQQARAEFGRGVLARRTQLGLSQEALADLASCHRATIRRIEHGEFSMLLDRVFQLAAALECSPADLFSPVGTQ